MYADIDPDACSTQTTKKKIAETSLDMGKKNAKGQVTAKGMWMGVDVNQETEFCHFLELPVRQGHANTILRVKRRICC